MPCGNGRLTFELAKHGYRVTGIDLAEEFIEEARASVASLIAPPANASGTDLNQPVEFVLGDMRFIEGVGVYDGAFCFGNSFGFLEYADMEKFLAGVARALKPGARFIVNTAMAAESVLPDFEEQSCHEMGDIVMTIKERYSLKRVALTANTSLNGTARPTRAKRSIGFTRLLKFAGCWSARDSRL